MPRPYLPLLTVLLLLVPGLAHAQAPARPAVIIYQDANFQGASQVLWPGRYDIDQIGIGNDQLSSVRIPQGWVVTLYEHGGSQGRTRKLTADTPWVGNDFNDITSSILVEVPNPGRLPPVVAPAPPPPPPEPEDIGSANLHVAHRNWKAGTPVILDYFNMPDGEAFAWVTIVKRGSSDGEWGSWTYTSGASQGQFNAGPLPPGEYEARAFLGMSDDHPADRLPLRVVP